MSLADRIDSALLRTAANSANSVRQAFIGAFDGDAIATAFLQTHSGKVSVTDARVWARNNVQLKLVALEAALRDVYGVGWALGVDSGKSHLASRLFQKAANLNDLGQYAGFDWSNWTPGNHAAEFLLRPPGGLEALLNRTRPTIISGIAQTSYDRVGTILADAMRTGATSLDVARAFISSNIERLASDPARALMVATTEMARGMSVASMNTYTEYGVEQVEWIGVDPCDDCAENEDAGPVALGDAFPTGDTEPPAHPNCRCTIAPVVDGFTPEIAAAPFDSSSDVSGSADTSLPMEISSDSSHAIDDVIATEPATIPEQQFDPATIKLPQPQKSPNYFTANVMKSYYPKMADGKIDWDAPLRSEYDPILTKQLSDLGFNAKPTLVSESELAQLSSAGWQPIYRGVAGNTTEEVSQFVQDFKTAETPFIGKGMFGNGTYFASEFDTAQNFASKDRLGEIKTTGQVINAALHPDAKVLDFSDVRLLLQNETIKAQWSKLGELDESLSNIIAAQGYDAIKIVNPIVNWKGERVNSTYWVILNRGALAVAK